MHSIGDALISGYRRGKIIVQLVDLEEYQQKDNRYLRLSLELEKKKNTRIAFSFFFLLPFYTVYIVFFVEFEI